MTNKPHYYIYKNSIILDGKEKKTIAICIDRKTTETILKLLNRYGHEQ